MKYYKCYIMNVGEFTHALLLSDDGSSLVIDIGEEAFNTAFAKCPVVRGLRAVYVRTSTLPLSFNAFDVFANTWSSENNKINDDFKLYTNINDAKSDSNPWTYCKYDLEFAGFPADCGPSAGDHLGPFRFFSMPGTEYSSNVSSKTSNNGLEIYTGDDCPSIGQTICRPPGNFSQHISTL